MSRPPKQIEKSSAKQEALTAETILLLLKEDIDALSTRVQPMPKDTKRAVEAFEKRYKLELGVSGHLDRRAFLSGERSSIHFIVTAPIPARKKAEYLKECEKLAELGIFVSIQPDGSVLLSNLNLIPEMSEEKRGMLIGFLEKAKEFAEKGEIERALMIHTSFLSIIDCLRAEQDAGKSTELAASYPVIGGKDVETMEIFKVGGKFSKEKFEELMGISYEDYSTNGIAYAARLWFTRATSEYAVAVTYYADVINAIIRGEKREEYEKQYLVAQSLGQSAGELTASASFILMICRGIQNSREGLTNIAELLVATGLDGEKQYSHISAKSKTQRKIAAGEIKIGDRKARDLSEITLDTAWGQELARPAIRGLVKDLQRIEYCQKLLIIYAISGELEKAQEIAGRISAIQKEYPAKFKSALEQYSTAMDKEAKIDVCVKDILGTIERIKATVIKAKEDGEITASAAEKILTRLGEIKGKIQGILDAPSFEKAEAAYQKLAEECDTVAKSLFGASLDKKIEDLVGAITTAKTRAELSEHAADALIERLNSILNESAHIKDYITYEGAEKEYRRLVGACEDIAAIFIAASAFEKMISQTKEKLRTANKSRANATASGSPNSQMTADERQLYDGMIGTVNEMCNGDMSKALERLRENYDPFTLLHRDVSIKDLVEGKKPIDKLFNMDETGSAHQLSRIMGFTNFLYALTWKVRGAPSESFEAIDLLGKHVITVLEDTDERIELWNTYHKLRFEVMTPEGYTEFIEKLLSALRELTFEKEMETKAWYEKIIPYTVKYIEKVVDVVAWVLLAVGIVASVITAEPVPAMAGTAGKAALLATVRRLAAVALKNILSPKNLGKTLLTKEGLRTLGPALGTGMKWATYPYLVGGTIVSADGIARYVSADGIEKQMALDQVRVGTTWLAGGLGVRSLLGRASFKSALPVFANRLTFAGTHGLFFTGIGISTLERFKGEQIDYLGLGGDLALLTIGSLSVVRGIRGLKTTNAVELGSKKIPRWKTALAFGGTVLELGVFIGGTVVYLKDYVSLEAREELSVMDALSRTKVMKETKAATDRIEVAAKTREEKQAMKLYAETLLGQMPKMTQQEKEKYELDMSERVVVQTLFPDLFDRYLSDDTTPEKRAAVVNEICKRIGWEKPDAAVFEYLRGQALAFSVHPSVVKESEPKLYAILDGQQEAIKANRRYMIR